MRHTGSRAGLLYIGPWCAGIAALSCAGYCAVFGTFAILGLHDCAGSQQTDQHYSVCCPYSDKVVRVLHCCKPVVWLFVSNGDLCGGVSRCHFNLPSVEAEEETHGKMPPIKVKFEIPYFTVSGMQVR